MALKIRCNSSLEYLGILAVARDFGPSSLLGCSENSDSGGGEESEKVTQGETEGATERATKRRSRRR